MRNALTILLPALVLLSACQVAAEVGERADRPANLLLDVSAAAVNAVVQRSVDRTEAVRETIQDTPVSGLARSLGTVRAELIPDLRQAVIDVVLDSRVYARTVAARPHVLVHTATVTPLAVRKRVVINGNAIHLLRGTACADSTSCLLDITSRAEPDYLALRLAHRGFEGSRPAAEAETAYKTSQKAADRLAEELAPALTTASKTIGRELSKITQAGLTLEALDLNTTADLLQVRARLATSGRVQPSPAPSLPDDVDVGLRIHDSVIRATARAVLGGKAFPVNEVAKFYEETTLGLLQDARNDAARKEGLRTMQELFRAAGAPATYTLTTKDPLNVLFADQGFQIEMHIASIRQEKSVFAGMRVRAAYKLVNANEGVLLVRQGPVQFLPADEPTPPQKKLDPQPATFKLLSEVLFGEVYKERLRLVVPMANVPARLRVEAPRAVADNGWLSVTWKLANRPVD